MTISHKSSPHGGAARFRFAYCSTGNFSRRHFLAWLLLVLLGVPATVKAQTVVASPAAQAPSQAAEEGLRRQEDRARDLQQQVQPKSDVLSHEVTPSVSTALPVESPCFKISEVRIVAVDGTPFPWLADSVAPYLNQCAGAAGLSQIAAAVDAKLIEFGYATSKVALPQQNLKDGLLILHLHVGRIAAIKMVRADAEKTPDENWGTWRNAFPTSSGRVLNIRDLEQGIEQMKRLPSQTVATELEPGDQPDTSNLVIVRQTGSFSDRLHGGLTLDNSGSRALGRSQFSGYASFDNPLGLNDILSLSVNSNAEQVDTDHRSQSASFNYSIPWGYNTFTFSKSNSRFAQIVQGTTAHFLSSGSSRTASFRWDYLAFRTSASKIGIYGVVSTRRASSFLDDVELVVQRRRTTNFETGVNYKRLVGNGSVDFELGHRRGVSWSDAEDDAPGAGEGGPTLRPDVWLLSASFRQPFNIAAIPLQYEATLRGQRTRDITYSVDQISIGNRYTVRGFDGENMLLAESGYYLRNEISMAFKLIEAVSTAGYIGLDIGHVYGASAANLVGDKLAGAAIGLRGQWKSMQFDASLATPLYKPQGFHTARWNAYLSLIWAF